MGKFDVLKRADWRFLATIGTLRAGGRKNSREIKDEAEVRPVDVYKVAGAANCVKTVGSENVKGSGMTPVLYERTFLAGDRCKDTQCSLVDTCFLYLVWENRNNLHLLKDEDLEKEQIID